ncbi:MAG: C45 family peptidase [Verrucomicrobiota bacterium]
MTRLFFRRLSRAVGFVLLLTAFNWTAANWLLWSNVDRIDQSLEQGRWPIAQGKISAEIFRQKPDGGDKEGGRVELFLDHNRFRARFDVEKYVFELGGGDATFIGNVKKGVQFAGPPTSFPECRKALREAALNLPTPSAAQRLVLSAWEHPWITGWARHDGRLCWRIILRHGVALVGSDGSLRSLSLNIPAGSWIWALSLQCEKLPDDASIFAAPSASARQVPAGEIDKSVAESLRILQLPFQLVAGEPDRFSRAGQGWLRIRDGHRLLHLEGTAYEIGYQHGRLLAPNIRRLLNRIVYGAGLYYSLEKGQWFPEDAIKLCERQSRWINPEYQEEMRGLAEGANMPLADVRRGNIFPEFFHCSGVAVFGKATTRGQLVHARVLDYMTEVGLQDEAVVIATHRTGALRWVNVGYAGFIGSVTGMNEKQIAIGEIGGGGEGQWGGTPMSFLLRGALENATTLDEAVDYMRNRQRTCEYFYVISDSKIPDAVGIAATPAMFQVTRAGEDADGLLEAVPDAVLISHGDYQTLVRRIRENYGRIDALKLLKIIKRPVAGHSNLHNAILEPQDLRIWVANASRNEPACDQPPVIYEWKDLFR